MRKLNLLSTCIALALTTQATVAADYLLDASTMAVGATAGENLIVKEGCLDPTKTTCTEKVKWLAAPLTKVGSVSVNGTLSGDFEVVVTADFATSSKTISLLTSDNKGISLKFAGDGGRYDFAPNGVGEGGSYESNSYYGLDGWNGGSSFNEIKIVVQQGLANVYTNGQIASGRMVTGTPIKLNAGTVFNQFTIQGITPDDRLSEVKVKGLSNTTACTGGSSTTTTPISGTTNTGDLPQISSNLDIKIPRGLYSQSGGLFTPAGSIPVWADLKYNAGGNYWTLSGAGVLPQ